MPISNGNARETTHKHQKNSLITRVMRLLDKVNWAAKQFTTVLVAVHLLQEVLSKHL